MCRLERGAVEPMGAAYDLYVLGSPSPLRFIACSHIPHFLDLLLPVIADVHVLGKYLRGALVHGKLQQDQAWRFCHTKRKHAISRRSNDSNQIFI